MKKVCMFAVFASMMFTACSNEDLSSVESNKNELGVSASITGTVSSRALVTEFVTSDQIGIFVTGTNYTPKLATYTCAASMGVTWTPPADADKIYLSNEIATIYGFYPANTAITGTLANNPNNTIDITVPPSRNLDGATDIVDYMYATGPLNVTYPLATASNAAGKNSVALVFHHALSKVSFIVNRGQFYTGNGKLSKVTLTSTAGSPRFQTGALTMNLETGAIGGAANVDDLVIEGTAKDINIYPTPATPSVTAQTLFAPIASTADITLKLIVDGKEMAVALPTAGATKWDAGKNYTYTITVNGTNLIVNSVSILGWDNITAGATDVQ